MSETTNLKLKKHDNVTTNTNQFDIENYMNDNWDKVDEFAGQVNEKVIEIEDNIDLVKQRTEQAVEDINTELLNKASKAELQEATLALQAELLATKKDYEAGTLEGQEEGESLYLQDSSDARFREFGIGGNDKQATRSGINFYNANDKLNFSDVVVVDKDDWITITGDNSSGNSLLFKNFMTKNNKNIKSNTTYYLVVEIKNIAGEGRIILASASASEVEGAIKTSVGIDFSDLSTGKKVCSVTTKENLESLNNPSLLRSYVQFEAGQSGSVTFRMSLLEAKPADLNAFEYEKYGAMPSLEFPSKIKAVKDSANVTVCNKNMLPTHVKDTQTVNGITVTNNEGRLTINGTATAAFQFDIAKNFYLPKINVVFNPNEIGGTMTNAGEGIFSSYSIRNADNTQLVGGVASRVGNNTKKNINADKLGNVMKFCTIWIPKNTVFNNFVLEPQIEAGNTATDYVEHEEQTFTIDVQQEMLEGDYFDLDNEEEVHTWGKYVFTGDETISKSGITNNNSFWMNSNFLPNLLNAEILNYTATDNITPNILCTHLKTLKPVLIVSYDNEGITICANDNNLTDITIRLGFGKSSEINTADKCKAWLKQQYDAGTPVTVYYKLAEPKRIPFTDSQKAVAKEIRQTLHSYKGGTHVYCTDEISPIFNVKYTIDQKSYIDAQLKPIVQELTGGN